MDKHSQRIVRNNLLGILSAALVLGALAGPTDSSSMLLFGVLYCVQVLVNLRLGLTHLGKRTTTGRSPAPYFLSALLVLIIGFGTCNFVVNSNLDRMD